MGKLEELNSIVDAENAAKAEALRKDEQNYNDAVKSGILGALAGGGIGFVLGFVGVVIFKLIERFFTKNESSWAILIFWIFFLGCAWLGYVINYGDKRIKKR